MSKLIRSLAAVGLLAAAPLSLNAQEEPAAQPQEVCTATIDQPIHTGKIVAVSAEFPAPFGEVTEIEAAPEAGLALATEAEKVEMAAEAEAETIELADDPNTSVFWLNARSAQPGTYGLVLRNEAGEACAAELEVQDPAGR